MARDPYAMEISPEERLKYRKEAYDSFANMQPALDTTQRIQRQKFSEEATAGIPGMRSEDISAQLGRAASGAATFISGQKQAQDTLSQQGAGMEQDIIGSKQSAALGQFARKQKVAEDEAARAVANRAFQLGMEAKELAFHDKAKIADIAMDQLAKDYQAGRVNKQELITMQNKFRMDAIKKKQEADEELLNLQGQFKIDMQNGNVGRAKSRLLKALEKQKDAAESAAKASNIAAVISGSFTVAGAIIGGPAGALAGNAAGNAVNAAVI